MLPGALLVGIGVGLTLPTLVAVASTSLPPERFATGSGVVTMARQVGFTLGVSVLVAVLGTPVGAVARLHADQLHGARRRHRRSGVLKYGGAARRIPGCHQVSWRVARP